MRDNLIAHTSPLAAFAQRGVTLLRHDDPALYRLLQQEYQRQNECLMMVAASSLAAPSVLACEGMAISNVTTEGYPGGRFHAGCAIVDEIERLAIERAKQAFQARYANVQPHSGTSANEIVLFSLLKPGDTVMGLDLNSGGHLTHGAAASISGQYFHAVGYTLGDDGFLDYDAIHQLACQHHPKLLISGASAYPGVIDFRRLRAIADDVGAYLLADISHIAGLVVAGEHPSPIDHAHFTTTSTYKQLFGPRGGLILMGKDYDSAAPRGKKTLAEMIQRAVFPMFQGTPHLNAIAAKARALAMVVTPEFRRLAQRIVADAKTLAHDLQTYGYRVLTGGTANHLVLIDVGAGGMTGIIAEKALESCNIIINKNRIPGDTKPPLVTSGIRLGTNSIAMRSMGEMETHACAGLIHQVLTATRPNDDRDYTLDDAVRRETLAAVRDLCRRFPIPDYPQVSDEDAREVWDE